MFFIYFSSQLKYICILFNLECEILPHKLDSHENVYVLSAGGELALVLLFHHHILHNVDILELGEAIDAGIHGAVDPYIMLW